MPKSCSKILLSCSNIFLDNMSNFNNNCFVINIKVQLSNQLQQIRQPLVESKWLVTKSQTVSVTIWFTNLANCCFRANCSFNGVFDFFVFGRQRGVCHFAYTQSTGYPNLVPRAFPFSWGRPPRERKRSGDEVEATQTQFL